MNLLSNFGAVINKSLSHLPEIQITITLSLDNFGAIFIASTTA